MYRKLFSTDDLKSNVKIIFLNKKLNTYYFDLYLVYNVNE